MEIEGIFLFNHNKISKFYNIFITSWDKLRHQLIISKIITFRSITIQNKVVKILWDFIVSINFLFYFLLNLSNHKMATLSIVIHVLVQMLLINCLYIKLYFFRVYFWSKLCSNMLLILNLDNHVKLICVF